MLPPLDDSSWAEIFGEGQCICPTIESVRGCPIQPVPRREQIVEILGQRDGENDGDAWLGVFRLDDGRLVFAEGSCDFTGWD